MPKAKPQPKILGPASLIGKRVLISTNFKPVRCYVVGYRHAFGRLEYQVASGETTQWVNASRVLAKGAK